MEAVENVRASGAGVRVDCEDVGAGKELGSLQALKPAGPEFQPVFVCLSCFWKKVDCINNHKFFVCLFALGEESHF